MLYNRTCNLVTFTRPTALANLTIPTYYVQKSDACDDITEVWIHPNYTGIFG